MNNEIVNPSEAILMDALQKKDIQISPAIFEKLCAFIRLLLEANETVNLTSITEYEAALVKHIYDALIITRIAEFQKAEKILDVGSGAGIPGIPLAIANPQLTFYLLEATQKKVNFQQQACETLQINNCHSIWGRAEDLGAKPEYREHFNLVLARAVAEINQLAELTLPFVKINGACILYKGKDFHSELKAGQNAITVLGGFITSTKEDELPGNYGDRALIIIQKQHQTPSKYPRKANLIQKKPL
ncbi:MAG TPA: 16S rRNA (guanine(527)-N(7))-methyltransferase RsmG [Bacillota bacterium]|nr:16S rRNA (guanine(527)-N(7))-methyltransferase RsmG [Bacillota bacterium]